ncbi:MAG TPA: RusA family crossover junction endodeoxyribonuclease [Arsenophonus sp.]
MGYLEYPIVPVPKPRMTQRDVWQKRPVVLRYRTFCDEVKNTGLVLPESDSIVVFQLPMPKSWSKKKHVEMDGKPHQQKPDVDNLLKALMDAVFKDDCTLWHVTVSKIWGTSGKITVMLPETRINGKIKNGTTNK